LAAISASMVPYDNPVRQPSLAHDEALAELTQELDMERFVGLQADENHPALTPEPAKEIEQKPIQPSCVLNCGSSTRWTSALSPRARGLFGKKSVLDP
jgi:hypothetical protein